MTDNDKKMTLYYGARSRAITVKFLLEELGIPHETKVLNLRQGEQKQSDYLAINPMGKVPALMFGETVITEATAICCFLADTFREKGLSIDIDDPRRGPYLKWFFFTTGCLEPAVIDNVFKRENPDPASVGYGTIWTVFNTIETALAKGPYLFGDEITAADLVLGSALHWAGMVGALKDNEKLTSYAKSITDREAYKRTIAFDLDIYNEQQKLYEEKLNK